MNRFDRNNLSQRDQTRQQLFNNIPDKQSSSLNNGLNTTPISAYDNNNKFDYKQDTMAQLESQSNDEINTMTQKIRALKGLTLRMGDEIRGSNQTLNDLGDNFENTTKVLKKTFNNMMIMAKNSKITLKTWLVIFFIITILFFWVWIT